MQMLYFKELDGILSNHHAPVGQLSSAPWWVQSCSGDSSGHFNSSPAANETEISGDHLGAAKQVRGTAGQDFEKGVLTRFPMLSERSKSSGDAQKLPVAISSHSECTRFGLGLGQPMLEHRSVHNTPVESRFMDYFHLVDSKSRLVALNFSRLGQMMLPLNLTTDEGPIYVNAKQYNGILKRHKSRAKAAHVNKTVRVRKPYMHVYRHLHAMCRPRSSGGRFLNLSSEGGAAGTKKDSVGFVSQRTGSPSSEVLQSARGTSNSQKDGNGSIRITSGSEVTSTFTRLDLDQFAINHSRPLPPIYLFPGMTENIPRSIVVPSKWVDMKF